MFQKHIGKHGNVYEKTVENTHESLQRSWGAGQSFLNSFIAGVNSLLIQVSSG